MKLQKFLFTILFFFLFLLVSCSNKILLDENNDKLLNYIFKISDEDNIDSSLRQQTFCYSTDKSKKYIAVITYDSLKASLNQYIIDKNYDRQNLYFKSLNSGNEKLTLKYAEDSKNKDDFFELTLNIKIK